MKIKLVCIILLFCSFLFGQQEEGDADFNIPIRVGYFADNGVHPGLKLGTSMLLKEVVQVRTYRSSGTQSGRASKTIYRQYLADANLGYYHHPNNHNGFFVGLGVTRKLSSSRTYFSRAWSFEVNYLRRSYNIETVEFDNNGNLNTVARAGNNSLMFVLAPTLSRLFGAKNGGVGTEIYIKPSLQILKYNHSFFPNAAIEAGFELNLFHQNFDK